MADRDRDREDASEERIRGVAGETDEFDDVDEDMEEDAAEEDEEGTL
jgi:hypothetical protein